MNMRFTRAICGMIGRLVKGQHWRDAGIEPIENRAPFALRTRAEYRLDPARAVEPDVGVEIVGKIPGVEAKPRQKRIMELALKRADGDVPAIGGFIAAIEIGASIEKIAGAPPVPQAHLHPASHLGQQNRNTVDHRHVENLALARSLPLDQRSEYPHGEECAAAAEVTDQIERRRRRRVTWPDRIEGAGEREIVDVMSRTRCLDLLPIGRVLAAVRLARWVKRTAR